MQAYLRRTNLMHRTRLFYVNEQAVYVNLVPYAAVCYYVVYTWLANRNR